jgi:pimeloyl-ACP methyl ester carboxylesterase
MQAAVAGLDAIFDYRLSPMASVLQWMQDHSPRTLVGMSLGAHLCVVHLARVPTVNGLILIAPAWTDQPEPGFTEHLANLRKTGLQQHLAHLPDKPAWVRDALRQAWNQYPEDVLLNHLYEGVTTPGPGFQALQAVCVPTVIVGFWDDPFHPWSVAEQWATAIPNSRLIGIPSASAERDLGNIGNAAVKNLQDLGGWGLGYCGGRCG